MVRFVFISSILLILMGNLFGQVGTLCSVCSDEKYVDCLSCKATGKVFDGCKLCRARGHHACLTCDPQAAPSIRKSLSPAFNKATREVYITTLTRFEKKAKDARNVRRAAQKRTGVSDRPPKKGRVDCTNAYCKGGKTLWQGGDTNPCKVCRSKGTMKCTNCRGGKAPCIACQGLKGRNTSCVDCAGGGRLPCPACNFDLKSDKCVLCDGEPKLACARCRDNSHKQ